MVLADFDLDGTLDIAAATTAANSGSNVTLFLGKGDGTFPVEVIVPSPSADSSGVPLAAGDLNGDGKPDLIIFGNMILLNNGDGTFSEGPTLTFAYGPMALVDLNSDQKLDLVAAVPNLSEALGQADIVSVLRGDGDGGFAQFPSYAVAAAATSEQTFAPSLAVVASDFDGNGKPDLAAPFVVPNETGLPKSANLGMLLNNGAGFQPATTTVAQSGNLETGTAFVAAGDFNGDGKMDVAEAYIGSVSILLGKGDGTFQSAVQYGAGMSGPIAVGDFNGDGKLDVVGVNAAISPGVSVLLRQRRRNLRVPGELLDQQCGDWRDSSRLQRRQKAGRSGSYAHRFIRSATTAPWEWRRHLLSRVRPTTSDSIPPQLPLEI